MFLSQHVLHTPAVRLRAIATPHVNAATLRSSCIVHGKTTAAQVKEREMIEASLSDLGTPVVDYLLETSPYSQFLDDNAITSMRDREKSLGDAATGEKLRRLRIAFANKGRRPWNAGKSHKPGEGTVVCGVSAACLHCTACRPEITCKQLSRQATASILSCSN